MVNFLYWLRSLVDQALLEKSDRWRFICSHRGLSNHGFSHFLASHLAGLFGSHSCCWEKDKGDRHAEALNFAHELPVSAPCLSPFSYGTGTFFLLPFFLGVGLGVARVFFCASDNRKSTTSTHRIKITPLSRGAIELLSAKKFGRIRVLKVKLFSVGSVCVICLQQDRWLS